MKKIFFALLCVLVAAGAILAQAQTPNVFSDFFPDAAEIGAASRTFSQGFEDAANLAKVTNGKLVSDVGFIRYERADYSGDSPLSIEVFTLLDSLAAYSLLTLLGENPVKSGPPGDALSSGNNSFLFTRGRIFVRVLGKNVPAELLEKTAAAVGAKTEHISGGNRPGLIDFFPSDGFDISSLRYFPSTDAYKTWSAGKTPDYIDADSDMEIATARYFAGNLSGTFFLLKFPTPELAEEYYDELASVVVPGGNTIFARSAGPLVACIEGNFDPVSANRLLSEIKFSYSLHWIDDDGSNSGIIWGIPSVILLAVVRSLIFSFAACVIAVFIGSAIGAGRFALRQYKEKRSPVPLEEDPGFTRLNLRKR